MHSYEGLVHVSEFSENKMKEIKSGDTLAVKLTGFDFHGRAKLVHKELTESAPAAVPAE